MLRFAPIAVVLLLSGCTPGGVCTAKPSAVPLAPKLQLLRPTLTVELAATTAGRCDAPEPAIEHATVEVTNQTNQLVPSSVTTEGLMVKVTFEPKGPGWHHVRTVATHGGADEVLQIDVLVVAEATPSTSPFEVPVRCGLQAQRTSSGAVLCKQRLFRPDGGEEAFGGGVVGGDELWTMQSDPVGAVERYRDTGDALERLSPDGGAPGFPSPGFDAFLLAGSGELWMVRPSPDGTLEANRYVAGATGSIERQTGRGGEGWSTLQVYAAKGPGGVLAGSSLLSGLPARDGGLPANTERTVVCPILAEADGLRFDPCTELPGRIIGSRGGLWVLSDRTLRLFQPDPNALRAQLVGMVQVPAQEEFLPIELSQLGPLVSGGPQFRTSIGGTTYLAVPRLEEGELTFEAYRLDGEYDEGATGEGLDWISSPSRTRVFLR